MGDFKNFAERRKVGCYVSCDYTTAVGEQLGVWCVHHLVPEPLAPSKYHTTILYSRADVPTAQEIVDGLKPDAWEFSVIGFKLFDSKEDHHKRALVLELKAPQLIALHKSLIKAGGTHDYPDFTPHVTVSYVAPRDLALDHLKLPTFKLKVKGLKVAPLNKNWKDNL